jgi:DNA-binding transcriptional MocR family regulator
MTNHALIDFSRSLPPVAPSLHAGLTQAFAAIAAASDLGARLHQSIARGTDEERAAGGRFVASRFGRVVEAPRVILANGTQSAIQLLLRSIVGPGGTLAAERLSYGPLRLLADLAGVRLVGLDIDGQGLIPAAFEAACRAGAPAALYCNPTVQNPTTAVMPLERRIAIAEIARRYGVVIVEDEALGRLHEEAPKPIASFAPDLTWYVMSTTKCLAHGLRLAYVVAPSADAADRMLAPIEHLSYWHPSPLAAALVTWLVTTGTADVITGEIARECAARERVAREMLAETALRSQPGSMHVWVDLPSAHDARRVARDAEQQGLRLRSFDRFLVDDRPSLNGLRLSLSAPASIDELARGLERLRPLLTAACNADVTAR